MNNAPLHTPDRWRRHKLAAIPALALVFAVMLYRNFPRSDVPLPAPPPRQPVGTAPAATPSPAALAFATTNGSHWPNIDLEEIMAMNPFGRENPSTATPAAASSPPNATHNARAQPVESEASPPEVENVETVLSDRVRALYYDREGAAAIVGQHIVHPGDLLENGLQVVSVTAEGITVKRQPPNRSSGL